MSSRMPYIALGLVLAAAGVHQATAQQQDPFAQADCQTQFQKLRGELDKRGSALQKAGDSKAPAPEVCTLLRRYTATEAQLIKFFNERKAACQIPDEVVTQAKQSHGKALQMRDNVCRVAAAPPPPPPSMGLSGALGGTGGAPAATAGGSGVFDTLTGNVLQR